MHQALYRKYRPSDFSDVVGQDHITSVLRYEAANEKTSHAYLFCGSRGTGKTTCAKILAKAVNCLAPVKGDPCCKCENCLAVEKGTTTDVVEMDAASNTGVDYIRDIKDAVMYAPTMLKCRVYIIDEVHMLSDGAFNALLKTLEEPPSNVMFILATTEMQKIPATILSRCQRFEFRRIASSVIADRLLLIARKEGISLTEEAAYLIARNAQGGMRDAISLLELCSADGKTVDAEMVEELSGGAGRKTVEKTVRAITDKDGGALFDIVADIYRVAGDMSSFWQELIAYYRDMILLKTVGDLKREELRKDILDLTESEFNNLSELTQRFKYETLIYHSEILDKTLSSTGGKTGLTGRVAAEMALIRLTTDRLDHRPEALLSRIAALEDRLAEGVLLSPKKPVVDKGRTEPPQKQQSFVEERPEKPAKEQTAHHSAPSFMATVARKELKDFIEIIHDYTRAEPGVAAFLNGSKAYLASNGGIAVCVSNDFAIKMLEKADAAAKLARIVKAKEGMDATITFEVCGKTEPQGDSLDELT